MLLCSWVRAPTAREGLFRYTQSVVGSVTRYNLPIYFECREFALSLFLLRLPKTASRSHALILPSPPFSHLFLNRIDE